jgi:hypothetical protein
MYYPHVDPSKTVARAWTENNSEVRDCVPFKSGEELGK